jgi:hypothetical protein
MKRITIPPLPKENLLAGHTDPVWRDAENGFVFEHVHGEQGRLGFVDHLPADVENLRSIRDELIENRNDDEAYIRAIKRLGIQALPGRARAQSDAATSRTGEREQLLAELHELLFSGLTGWLWRLEWGESEKDRKSAQRLLKKVGPALAGERRGRTKPSRHDPAATGEKAEPTSSGIANPLFARRQYLRQLFRLTQVLLIPAELRHVYGRASKIARAAEIAGVDEDVLAGLCPSEDADGELRKPLSHSPEDAAKIATAKYFRVTRQTLENVLSATTPPPRKNDRSSVNIGSFKIE